MLGLWIVVLLLTTSCLLASPTAQSRHGHISPSDDVEANGQRFARQPASPRVPTLDTHDDRGPHIKRGQGDGGRGGKGGNAGSGGNGGKATYIIDVPEELHHEPQQYPNHRGHRQNHPTHNGYNEYGHERDRYFKEHEDELEHNRFHEHDRHRIGEFGHSHPTPGPCVCHGGGIDYGRGRYDDFDRLREEDRDRSRDRFGEEHERERDWVKHHGGEGYHHHAPEEAPAEKVYPAVSHGAGPPIANAAHGGDGGKGGNGGSGSYVNLG